MSPTRHGCRIAVVLLLLGAGAGGCAPGGPGEAPKGRDLTRTVARRPSTESGLVLEPPGGRSATVTTLAWGGPEAGRRLAVGLTDGRVAVYRPEAGPAPTSVAEGVPYRPARALAMVGADRLVAGDAGGVIAWDISGREATVLGRLDCWAVTAVLAGPGDEDPLVVGLEDGRLLRVRLEGSSGAPRAVTEAAAGTLGAVVALAWEASAAPGGPALLVVRHDGRLSRRADDLGGPETVLGEARAVAATAEGPARRARLVAGPALMIDPADPEAAPWRFPVPGRIASAAFLEDGARLAVVGAGALLWLPLDERGRCRPEAVRTLAGPMMMAADPAAGRLATADATGRVEVLTVAALETRAAAWPLDDAADLAFQPHRRLYRPRSLSAAPDLPGALQARLDAARAQLERGELDDLRGLLNDLDADPNLDRLGGAEVRAMIAAVDQAEGRPPATVLKSLEPALAAFARRGAVDREADMRFWRGLCLAPPLDGANGAVEDPQLAEALEQFDRAAARYREVQPPLERPARLCEAARAWVLLARGDVRGAVLALRPVVEAARADPVLAQVPELDRIAAAISAARGDWSAAAALDARALSRIDRAERPALGRHATLARAGALAARNDWAAVADLLGPDPDEDAEWWLRRVTAQFRAGRPIVLPPPDPSRPAREAHVRGRLAAGLAHQAGRSAEARGLWEQAREALAEAAEAHRRAGRADLAAEADLERAEVLERLGRFAEALAVHAGVVRQLPAAGLGADRTRLAARPLASAGARPWRGLARCGLALDRPGLVLAALDAARGRPGAGPEPADPSRPFDPAGLGLEETEAALIFAAISPEAEVGVLVRGRHPPEMRVLPASRSEIRRAVLAWRSNLGEGGRSLRPAETSGPDGLLSLAPEPPPAPPAEAPRSPRPRGPSWESYLDDALIRPFGSGLLGVTRLVVVPDDDALGALPFEAIGREGRLAARLRLSYAPSAEMAARQARPSRGGTDWIQPVKAERALILAGPAAASRSRPAWASAESLRAVADAAQLGGFAPATALGPEARPSRLLAGSDGGPALVHLSALATLDPSRSPFGQVDLRLASGDAAPRADGRLTAGDLAAAGPAPRVVSLAIGDPADRASTTGAGLRDLAAAWLEAGAETVLISLWDPPAASCGPLLERWHRGLAAGATPTQALARARAEIARDGRFRDPVHWAGFVLYGGP